MGAGSDNLEGYGKDVEEEDLDGESRGVQEGPINAVLPGNGQDLEEVGNTGPL